MKDAMHHLKHVQKKVVQAVRREEAKKLRKEKREPKREEETALEENLMVEKHMPPRIFKRQKQNFVH